MSKIRVDHVFTSESVSEGHPDKVCDQISDAILDACLAQDPKSRVACETLTTTNLVVNAGEITCSGWDQVDPEAIAREVCREIGYDREELEFCDKTFEYINRLHGQSPDISQGVTEGEGLFAEQGAGDQGMMFGYACNETDELMPAPIAFSHRLLDELQKIRKAGTLSYLRPDSKSQVSVQYKGGKPVSIETVVISHQTDDVPLETIREDLIKVCKAVLEPTGLLKEDTEYFINPTGKFVIGGPHGDAGLTGRKIIVDTYGGVGSHGGGAFSGKDPSKVDRSAAYYSRYAAKNIVAAGLAEKCEIQVAYAIGVPEPLSINVDTYGTGKVDDHKIEAVLKSGDIFDFRPSALIADLDLVHPKGWSYRESAAYGHFGRNQFPWEKTDKVDALKKALNI
ncbi:methionine adenosyltransferase [Pontiella agarivorans]|uniref:S-adenosylmethionine synthase n=1 Tax=Pontiella agarivorans TaxID=3038953 RepID=A0ABU5MTI6_9BACT|nr:methionine adenosyltransferase [Pontiella agarivorans]MDZ8117467.1 methionine adenosyltransferase [Pontiella agarivorans]